MRNSGSGIDGGSSLFSGICHKWNIQCAAAIPRVYCKYATYRKLCDRTQMYSERSFTGRESKQEIAMENAKDMSFHLHNSFFRSKMVGSFKKLHEILVKNDFC